MQERIDTILKQFRNDTQQMLGGSYLNNEPTLTEREAKQALLEAFEAATVGIIGKDDQITMVRGNRSNGLEPYRYIKASDMPKYYRNKLRQSQRNEAIKVIRGE